MESHYDAQVRRQLDETRKELAAVVAERDALRARLAAPAPTCPTVCDSDCDADCHEWHAVPAKRQHIAGSCALKLPDAA